MFRTAGIERSLASRALIIGVEVGSDIHDRSTITTQDCLSLIKVFFLPSWRKFMVNGFVAFIASIENLITRHPQGDNIQLTVPMGTSALGIKPKSLHSLIAYQYFAEGMWRFFRHLVSNFTQLVGKRPQFRL